MADNGSSSSAEDLQVPNWRLGRSDTLGSIDEVLEPVRSDPGPQTAHRSSSSSRPRRFSNQSSDTTRRRLSSGSPPSKVAWQKQAKEHRKTSEASFMSQGDLSGEGDSDQADEQTLNAAIKEIPGSRHAIGHFDQIIANDNAVEPMEIQVKKAMAKSDENHYGEIHRQFMAWHKAQQQSTRTRIFQSPRGAVKPPERPSEEELLGLVRHLYPARCDVRALVYDVYDDHATIKQVEVGKIQKYWEEKPREVVLRWVHVPFGFGIVQTTVEDLFRYAGPLGKPYANAGYEDIAYIETESLHFRSKEHFERMRDVYALLSKDEGLAQNLDKATFARDENEDFRRDLEWRADHTASSIDYWSLCSADVPCQLSETPMGPIRRLGRKKVMGGPIRGFKEADPDYQEQAIGSHPFFKDSLLVSNEFKVFHGADGFVMTVSSAKGVDYLDKSFPSHLQTPQDYMLYNKKASVIARVMSQFLDSGTRTWHRCTPEWFSVYLFTEIGSTPHHIVDGCTAPSLKEAYDAVVADLKRRRYEPWEQEKSIELVRDHINCVDELNALQAVHQQKKKIFSGLLKDCENMEKEWNAQNLEPNNLEGESCVERAKWAYKMAEENYNHTEAHLKDLVQSLDALFQLRSIEQNERAIVAERLNKAVFVFTGVTIIFLPLSFFTSYFGMNLQGIVDTSRTEKYFWSVCGTVSIIIVLCTILYAFRSQAVAMKGFRRRVAHKGLSMTV